MADRSGIAVDLAVEERVVLTDPVDNRQITLTLEHKSGQRARLRIEAPSDIRIGRPDRAVKVRP
jgi:hypothetical protein